MTVSRSAGKFAVRFLSFIVCIIVVIAGLSLTKPVQSVSADGGMWSNAYNDGNPDEQIVQFGLWGYDPGDVVEVTIEVSKYDFYTTAGSGVTVQEVNQVMKKYEEMKKMTKVIANPNSKKARAMMRNMGF